MRHCQCPATGKIPHPNARQAQRHLQSLKKNKSYKGGEVYLCRFCHNYHVGRPKWKRPRLISKGRKRRRYFWRVEYDEYDESEENFLSLA